MPSIIPRVTLWICATAMAVGVGCGLAFLPVIAALWLALTQGVAYGFLAIYAWTCRAHLGPSRYLLAVSLVCTALNGVILFLACHLNSGVHFIVAMWLSVGQAALAVFGGYLAYAAVDFQRTRLRGEDDSRSGKFVVVAILVAAVYVAAGTFWNGR